MLREKSGNEFIHLRFDVRPLDAVKIGLFGDQVLEVTVERVVDERAVIDCALHVLIAHWL